jgi:hypothetical protein
MAADSILFGFPYITMNVFTFGSHARWSHLVYEKAYGPGTEVGVIAWEPSAYGGRASVPSRSWSRVLATSTNSY